MPRTQRRTRAAVITLSAVVLASMLLTSCTALDGDRALPAPTRAAGTVAPTPTDEAVRTPGPDATAEAQDVPTGTVVAETDAVSKSRETSVHVRVVANEDGGYDAQFSDYRTTKPQRMTAEFRRSADYGQPWAESVGQVTWQADMDPPTSVSLGQAGVHPDWLHAVVLVPAASEDGTSDADRPWVGTVLAVGALRWDLPQPYHGLRAAAGAARPGAWGRTSEHDGVPVTYRVARGDDIETVAERFGLTEDQLAWLNPTLTLGGAQLYEDTALNLDPTAR